MQTQTLIGGAAGLIVGGIAGVVAGKAIGGPKELPELFGILGGIAGGLIIASLATPAPSTPTTVTPGGPAFVPGA